MIVNETRKSGDGGKTGRKWRAGGRAERDERDRNWSHSKQKVTAAE